MVEFFAGYTTGYVTFQGLILGLKTSVEACLGTLRTFPQEGVFTEITVMLFPTEQLYDDGEPYDTIAQVEKSDFSSGHEYTLAPEFSYVLSANKKELLNDLRSIFLSDGNMDPALLQDNVRDFLSKLSKSDIDESQSGNRADVDFSSARLKDICGTLLSIPCDINKTFADHLRENEEMFVSQRSATSTEPTAPSS